MSSIEPVQTKTVILQCSDLLDEFDEATSGLPLSEHDPKEVVMQILFMLLQTGQNAMEDFHLLPELSTLRYPEQYEENPEKLSRLQYASQRMARQLKARLDHLKAFATQNNGRLDFPYTFAKWRRRDVELDHMPF
jgi:hypothetical protein